MVEDLAASLLKMNYLGKFEEAYFLNLGELLYSSSNGSYVVDLVF